MIRRVGAPRHPDIRYKMRHGAYGVLLRKGQVLLTHQDEPVPEYQLPGGGIDPGESPGVALRRETLEETGWKIGRPHRLGAFREFVYMSEYEYFAEKLCHVFTAMPCHRMGEPSEEGHIAVWTDLPTAIDIVANPGSVRFLRKVMNAVRA